MVAGDERGAVMRPWQLENPKKFFAGLLFVVIGCFAAIKASDYTLGMATDMGPGYFPEALGLLLIALGIGIVANSFLTVSTLVTDQPRSLKPLLLILAGVVGFVATVDRFGLVPAIAILLACACFIHALNRPIEVFVEICVLIVFSVLLFIYGFSMPLNMF
jgi:hypothetical protein